MNLEFSRQIFEKYSIEFYENSPSGSRVAPCGETRGLMVALSYSVTASKKVSIRLSSTPQDCGQKWLSNTWHANYASPVATNRTFPL